jgi:hypothetical protein
MTPITTTNALTDFDLCLALSQSSINTQLDSAWKSWKAQKKLPDVFDLLKKKDGGISKYGLKKLKIAPLTVSLAVPDAKRNQVMVHLRLESGTVAYLDEEKEAAAEYPIKDWGISFITDLEKQPVDLQKLEQIDPNSHKTARDLIDQSGLPESVFSIEYLFLKLTDLQLLLSGNIKSQIPPGVPDSAYKKALEAINLWFDKEVGQYLLGTIVRRKKKEPTPTPTFAMTDFVFSIHGHNTVPVASTLNYLGEFSRRPLPTDLDGARDKLKDAWLRPEQINGQESNVAGVMAISSAIFLEKYLIPKIAEALWYKFDFAPMFGVAYGRPGNITEIPVPPRKGLTWAWSETRNPGASMNQGILNLRYTAEEGYSLEVKVMPSTNQISIKGRVTTKAHYDAGLTANDTTEWYYADGHRDVNGSLNLTGNGSGRDFNLETKLEFNVGETVPDQNRGGGAVKINEVWKWLTVIPETPENLMKSHCQKISNALKNAMEVSLKALDLDLKQHTFIPPGGGVFTFQNARFSNAGDLFFDVLYRAV